MDGPEYILYIVGLLVLIKTIQLGSLCKALLGTFYKQAHTTLVASDSIPTAQAPIFDAAGQKLSAFGFRYSHAEAVATFLVNQPPVYRQVYVHPQTRTYAHVNPAVLPEASIPYDIEFVTMFTHGHVLVTIDGLDHRQLPQPSWCHLQDPYVGGDLERQWRAHQDMLDRKISAAHQPILHTVEQAIEEENRYLRGIADQCVQIGSFRPVKQSQLWRLHPLSALKWAWKIQAGDKKRLAALKSLKKTASVSPATVSAEINAFERMRHIQQQQKWGWLPKSALFLCSAVACVLAFGLTFSWQTMPILLGVVLFHELGHLGGMWLCGYRDRQILFLPFLGAATLGQKDDATAVQKLIVYLLGPVPGLILGIGCLYLASQPGAPGIWYEIGLLAVVVNYLNLFPISPLDGGRIVETLFLTRFPRLRFAFGLCSVVIFVLAAWSMMDSVLFALSFILLFTLPFQWRSGTLAARVAKALPAHADEQTRLQTITQTLVESTSQQQKIAVRFQMIKGLMQHFATPPPSLRAMLMGGLIYLTVLLLPVASGIAYVVSALPDGQKMDTVRIGVRSILGMDVWPEPNWDKKLARANSPHERWEILMQAGRWQFIYAIGNKKGARDKAIRFFQHALEIANTFDSQDLSAVDTLTELAKFTIRDHHSEALSYYQQAIERIERGYGPYHLRIVDILQDMAWRVADDDPIGEQVAWLERALRIRKHHGLGHEERDAGLMVGLGRSYVRDRRLQDAVQALKSALAIYDAQPSQRDGPHSLHGYLIGELADVYMQQGQSLSAKQVLEDRIEQWHALADELKIATAFEAAELASQLGWIHVYSQDLPAAKKMFEDALAFNRMGGTEEGLADVLTLHVLDLCYLDLLQDRKASAQARFAKVKKFILPEDYGISETSDSIGSLQTEVHSTPAATSFNWYTQRLQAHSETVRRLL